MTIPSDPSELQALIQLLQTQQQRLQLRRFTNDDALELGSRIVAVARERKLAVTSPLARPI